MQQRHYYKYSYESVFINHMETHIYLVRIHENMNSVMADYLEKQNDEL